MTVQTNPRATRVTAAHVYAISVRPRDDDRLYPSSGSSHPISPGCGFFAFLTRRGHGQPIASM
jgi:hypothetical protein